MGEHGFLTVRLNLAALSPVGLQTTLFRIITPVLQYDPLRENSQNLPGQNRFANGILYPGITCPPRSNHHCRSDHQYRDEQARDARPEQRLVLYHQLRVCQEG